MNRRTFFRRTVGALATAAIAPRRLHSALPDDVWCERCGCWQLPDHISRDGMAWHAANGEVFVWVRSAPGDRLYAEPWPGGPPPSTRA